MLNYGRVTFGATCTGHAKACIKAMTEYAKKRVQFQQALAEFQLVQKKIAFAAAHTFAMEAANGVDVGRRGILTRHRDGRIAGEVDERKGHHAGDGDDECRQQQPLGDEGEHRLTLSVARDLSEKPV